MASPPADGGDRSLAGYPGALRPLTGDLIATVLASRGYAVDIDPAGDLVGRWADSLIWFLRPGTAGELLQVRTVTAPMFAIEYVPALHAFCNAWNHDRFQLKAFVHVEDDGRARICGEVITDLEHGVTPHQLDRLLDRGITTGCELAAEVARLPGAVLP